MTSAKEIMEENIKLGKVQAYFYEIVHSQIFNVIEQRRLRGVIGNLAKKVDTYLPALDIGSGTGNIANHLRHFGLKVIACDISLDMLKENRYTEYKVVCDACALPFRSETFGLITAYSVVQHFRDAKVGLEEICRVAAKGSFLYFDRLPFLDTTSERFKGLKGFFCQKFETLTWLILRPKYLKRFFE
ncbi:MAG: hypothetical protein DRO36_04610 [Candidatus Hecatellales archaeon]|nr:MAG: hypothetical protein DRO36_04610 [Candidatus Hecatellales archaeon]